MLLVFQLQENKRHLSHESLTTSSTGQSVHSLTLPPFKGESGGRKLLATSSILLRGRKNTRNHRPPPLLTPSSPLVQDKRRGVTPTPLPRYSSCCRLPLPSAGKRQALSDSRGTKWVYQFPLSWHLCKRAWENYIRKG